MRTEVLICQPLASFVFDKPECDAPQPAECGTTACPGTSSATPVGANGAIIAALAAALTKLAPILLQLLAAFGVATTPVAPAGDPTT